MKSLQSIWPRSISTPAILRYFLCVVCLSFMVVPMQAQEEEEEPAVVSDRPVRATFESALLADNQSVMVPIKGTFEFDIQHRFGTINKSFEDLFGLYATSNIRLGFLYAPINNLSVGFGFTKFKNLLDFNAKYSILKQRKGWRIPVSVTYYGNMVLDPRKEDIRGEVFHQTDRFSYFHQLIIARKINDWLSIQVAPSLSHYNMIAETYNNDHIAIAVGAQVKVTESMSVLLNVDQPLTLNDNGNPSRNPNPNFNLGIQMSTSSHAFQIFLGNYNSLVPQENNVYYNDNLNYDHNKWTKDYWSNFSKRFRIGFNITRLWNF